jgi:tetratricopeptide (TPR) repeat protein
MRKLLIVLAVAGLAVLAVNCNQLKARDQVNKGVQAFKNAQYPEAVENFKRAVVLDPTFVSARQYLAVAYMLQYIPGADSPENNKMADAAREQFMKVLDQDPKNTTSMSYLASLYLNQKKWAEARQWNEKLVAVDPNNADAYYSLGFITWSEWFPEYGTARANLGMRPDDPGPIKDKKVREELKAKYMPMIQSGLQALDKALQINPEYDDAMAYENLLIREAADLTDSKDEYEKQIKIADNWMQKALDTKKRKAEKKASQGGGGIVSDAK